MLVLLVLYFKLSMTAPVAVRPAKTQTGYPFKILKNIDINLCVVWEEDQLQTLNIYHHYTSAGLP